MKKANAITCLCYCAPEENSYHGGIRRFWPFLKIIAAKLLVKLELALHSMAWSLPKSPNRNFELSQLFQSNSLNRPQSLCNLGVESPSRLEKCPNRVGEEMVFCVTQRKEKDEICWCNRETAMCSGVWKDLVSSFILLTLRQFLYTLAITDEDKKRLCNRGRGASKKSR